MKIIFHSHTNKTNFHMKSFARSLAFIVRFTATRKWPILFTLITKYNIFYSKKKLNVQSTLLNDFTFYGRSAYWSKEQGFRVGHFKNRQQFSMVNTLIDNKMTSNNVQNPSGTTSHRRVVSLPSFGHFMVSFYGLFNN